MYKLITASGISTLEAIQGVMKVGESSYNIRNIIKDSWSAMPILKWKDITDYEENPKSIELLVEDIIRTNDLDISVETFVKAQDQIFKRNINPNTK